MTYMSPVLGNTFRKKEFGQLGPLFLDVKSNVLRVWRNKVPIMVVEIIMAIMMMVMMTTMPKKDTNIITFEEKCINWRNYYLVKKGATNSRWQWWSPGLGRCRKSIREAPPEKIVYHIWALLFKQRFPSPFSIPGTLYVVLLFADFKQIPQQ